MLISFSMLVCTHLVTAFLSLFAIGAYAGAHVLHQRSLRRLWPLLGAGVAAVACASIYLVPALAEREFAHLEWISESPFGDWRRNFVYRDEVASASGGRPSSRGSRRRPR